MRTATVDFTGGLGFLDDLIDAVNDAVNQVVDRRRRRSR